MKEISDGVLPLQLETMIGMIDLFWLFAAVIGVALTIALWIRTRKVGFHKKRVSVVITIHVAIYMAFVPFSLFVIQMLGHNQTATYIIRDDLNNLSFLIANLLLLSLSLYLLCIGIFSRDFEGVRSFLSSVFGIDTHQHFTKYFRIVVVILSSGNVCGLILLILGFDMKG